MPPKARGVRDRDSILAAAAFNAQPSTTVWLDGNRTDTYVEDGTVDKPYKTAVAAAARLTAIAAAGGIEGALVVAPADYPEDPVFAPVGTFGLGIFGYGRHGQSRIRSFGFTPGAGTLQITIDHMAFGGLGGVTTAGALYFADGVGALFVALENCNINRATAGSAVDVAAGAGQASIRLDGCQVSAAGAGAPVTGWAQARGALFGWGEIGGFDAPAVLLSGSATCALDRFVLIVGAGIGPPDVDCVSASGAGALCTLTNIRAEPKGAGDAIAHAGAATLICSNVGILTGTGAGGIVSGGGSVIVDNCVNLALGAPVPFTVTGAAAVLPMTPGVQVSSLLATGLPAATGLALLANGLGGLAFGSPLFPAGYLSGLGVTWLTGTTGQIEAGDARAGTGTGNISAAGVLGFDTAAPVGAGGLDAGVVAGLTWYAVYAIGDSTGANPAAAILSTSAVAPAFPAGYDLSRQVGWVRTDGAALILEFLQVGNGPTRVVRWLTGSGPHSPLINGGAVVPTLVSLIASVPPGARLAALELTQTVANGSFYVTVAGPIFLVLTVAEGGLVIDEYPTTAAQAVAYAVVAGGLATILVHGYTVSL